MAEHPTELIVPLSTLVAGQKHSLTSLPPFHYRFLSVSSFLSSPRLVKITSHTSLPSNEPYATVSYPWDGLNHDFIAFPPALGSFNVLNVKESVGPLNADILNTVCLRAQAAGIDKLWVDQLCIQQQQQQQQQQSENTKTKEETDSSWHIKYMGGVYKESAVCYVLAGGFQKLCSLLDETSWIGRCWTLQEALLPKKVECVFEWTETRPVLDSYNSYPIDVLQPGVSAVLEIQAMLTGVLGGLHYKYVKTTPEEEEAVGLVDLYEHIEPKVFAHTEAYVLQRIMEVEDPELHEAALWRSAWLRSARYGRDMALCMMALFGVTLNPSDYCLEDQTKPMLDLAKAILARGGRANWIGVSFKMPLSPVMSTMCLPPDFSTRRAAWKVGGELVMANTLVEPYWLISKAVKGETDGLNYMRIRAPARKLRLAKRGEEGVKMESTRNPEEKWVFVDDDDDESQYYGVQVGEIETSIPGVHAMMQYEDTIIIMIVKFEDNDKYNVKDYARVKPELMVGNGWEQMQLSVGGPAVV